MATMDESMTSRAGNGTESRIRVGGGWLAVGSLLLVLGLLLHPPPSPEPSEFMATIAQDPGKWVAAHAVTIVALVLVTIASLILLTTPSRLTGNGLTTTAWSAMIVGAVLITTAAFLEGTVITSAAVAGDTETFLRWSPFAEGHAMAVILVALGVAAIAFNEARSGQRATPGWAAWVGTIAGLLSAGGFLLGIGLGVAIGGLVWLVSTVVMSLWTLWFGVALTRADGHTLEPTRRSVDAD